MPRTKSAGEPAASSAPKAVAEGDKGDKPRDNNRYRKPKPWDTDDIDHWKLEVRKLGSGAAAATPTRQRLTYSPPCPPLPPSNGTRRSS